MNAQLMFAAFADELEKIGEEQCNPAPKDSKLYKDVAKKFPELTGTAKTSAVLDKLRGAGKAIGKHLVDHDHAYDVAGLGILAAPAADKLQAKIRAGKGAGEHDVKKKELLGGGGHIAAELGGLGTLAAPTIAKMVGGHH